MTRLIKQLTLVDGRESPIKINLDVTLKLGARCKRRANVNHTSGKCTVREEYRKWVTYG